LAFDVLVHMTFLVFRVWTHLEAGKRP
jgi:hypothetical protein